MRSVGDGHEHGDDDRDHRGRDEQHPGRRGRQQQPDGVCGGPVDVDRDVDLQPGRTPGTVGEAEEDLAEPVTALVAVLGVAGHRQHRQGEQPPKPTTLFIPPPAQGKRPRGIGTR